MCAPSTIRGYASAISAFHPKVDGAHVFSHDLIRRYIKGSENLRERSEVRPPPWDLPLVLNALCEAPFEPLEEAGSRELSIKTALLLALVSGKRRGELCALSAEKHSCIITGDEAKAVLFVNPAFKPKVVTGAYVNTPLTINAFHLQPNTQEERRLHLLCPVRALAQYIRHTSQFRVSNQLFICYGPGNRGKALSDQRLSNWLTEGIRQAYLLAGKEPPSIIRAHSTRGVSTSTALFTGVPIESILTAASWASPNAFVRYYLHDQSEAFASSVLSQASRL